LFPTKTFTVYKNKNTKDKDKLENLIKPKNTPKKLEISAGIFCGYATGRAEDVAKLSTHRGKYDIAVARAVAKLSTIENYLPQY